MKARPMEMMSRRVAVLATLIALPAALFAQQRDLAAAPAAVRAGTSALSGVVVTDTQPTQPLRRVLVTIDDALAPGRQRVAITDDAGRYAFSGLPAGRYLVTAAKAGYLNTAYGVKGPLKAGASASGTAVVLADGGRASNVDLKMSRGAVVTGTIADANGVPAPSTSVSLECYTRLAATGERLFGLVSFEAETDDRGTYRIFGVPPGEYILMVRPGIGGGVGEMLETKDADVQRALELIRNAASGVGASASSAPFQAGSRRPSAMLVPVYYPGTTSLARATPIVVRVGEERGGIDVQLQRVMTVRIEGAISGSDGRPMPGASVLLTPTETDGVLASRHVITTSDAQGRFRFLGVAPGPYGVLARSGGGSASAGAAAEAPTWAQADVAIQGEDVNLSLALQPATTVTGRIVFGASTTAPPGDLSRVRVSIYSGSGGPNLPGITANADVTGQFTLAGVIPGKYRLTASISSAPQWLVKTSTIGGRDALDQAREIRAGDGALDATITLTDKSCEISGTVLDAAGRPAPEYTIVVFSTNRAYWVPRSRRIQQARPAHDGTFKFQKLPPGDYLIAAVTDLEQGQWFDSSFLAPLVDSSIKLTLLEGDRKTQDVRMK